MQRKLLFPFLAALLITASSSSFSDDHSQDADAFGGQTDLGGEPPAPPPPPTATQVPAPTATQAPATAPTPAPTATQAPAGSAAPTATQAPPPAGAPPGGGQLQTAAQVVWVRGTVKATYPDQTARVLARGSAVYEKDTINTEGDGSGEISFTDNTIVTLNPSTVFKIEQYFFNQEKPSQGGQYVMNLVKGGFRTVTGFVAKAQPANYQVKTPVATIGVRGTDYQGVCPKTPGQCAFGLLHGKGVTMENEAGIFNLTPDMPYGTINTSTSAAILSKTAPGILGKPLQVTPANSPASSGGKSGGGGGGNCGILIN